MHRKKHWRDSFMKKAFGFLLALTVLLLSVSAFADGIRIGIINLDPEESGYRRANVEDLQKMFTAENGYDASFVTAVSVSDQQKAFMDFVEADVKYILLSAAGTDGWDETLQAAKNKGIGVILFDRIINCDKDLYLAAVISDMKAEGLTAVAWLENLGLNEYNILHIQGQLDSAAQKGRSEPLQEKCAQEPSWTIVYEGSGGDMWSPDEAYRIAIEALDAGMEFNVVYAENNGMAKGVCKALDERNISYGPGGDVVIMGFDCDKWALENLRDGKWNYVGQCSPFQAGIIDSMISSLESGESIESRLNDKNQFINVEFYFDNQTITQEHIDVFGT